ncbi:hypothetical protein EC991_010628 [Linnemannia zychae]|nr:hypothetical protein EC991_010628 [Linnemannia zychae]
MTNENIPIPRFIQFMPHLVRLRLGVIKVNLVAELGKTCRNLKSVQFDIKEPCCKEMSQIFVSCSRLTHFKGEKHVVLYSDIIQEPYWICLGLQNYTVLFEEFLD